MPKVLGVELVWDDEREEEARCKTPMGDVCIRFDNGRGWLWEMGETGTQEAVYGGFRSYSFEEAAADAHIALELLIKKARKIEYVPPSES